MHAICDRFAATLRGIQEMDQTARAILLNPDILRCALMESYNEQGAIVGALFWREKSTLEGIGYLVASAHLFEASKVPGIPQSFRSTSSSSSSDRAGGNPDAPFDDSRAQRFIRSTLRTLQRHPDIEQYLQLVYSYINEQLRICTNIPTNPWLRGSQITNALSSVSLLRYAGNHMTQLARRGRSRRSSFASPRIPHRKIRRGE